MKKEKECYEFGHEHDWIPFDEYVKRLINEPLTLVITFTGDLFDFEKYKIGDSTTVQNADTGKNAFSGVVTSLVWEPLRGSTVIIQVEARRVK